MKIEKIEFKITTTKNLVCGKCGEMIEGKEGYMKISVNSKMKYPYPKAVIIKICHKCFEETIGDYWAGRKKRNEDWHRLLKKRILMGLR